LALEFWHARHPHEKVAKSLVRILYSIVSKPCAFPYVHTVTTELFEHAHPVHFPSTLGSSKQADEAVTQPDWMLSGYE
jgi:hypothetical protein